MLPSAGRTASASQQWLDFGAEPSRPASLLCTLHTHQSPGEWQHSLPACSLALTGRGSHPLDFIKWFPLLHCWFLHFHASPSATYRKPRLAHYGSRRAHVTCYTASLHLVDFKCASSFGEAQQLSIGICAAEKSGDQHARSEMEGLLNELS